MRSAIVEMIDGLVAELAAHKGIDTDATIGRLKEIRELAEQPRSGVLDCSEQLAFPFAAETARKDGRGRGQTGGGGAEGEGG